MTCHYCRDIEMVKFGIRNGVQRFQCKVCRRTKSEPNPLDNLRVPFEKAVQVVSLLTESNGIRAIERLTGLNRRTVLNILTVAGQKAAAFLDAKVRNVNAQLVQADEINSFVFCKQRNAPKYDDEVGDQFTFLSVAKDSKLIINSLVGKRTRENAETFMQDLKSRMANRFQLTTDNWTTYSSTIGCVSSVFGQDIDFAVETKYYAKPEMYLPRRVIGLRRKRRIGNPDLSFATTCHAERTNLSVRLFNRRFTRCTLGFSKKLENMRHAVALFIWHFNFCRVHSAHGETPAQAAKLTDKKWEIKELFGV